MCKNAEASGAQRRGWPWCKLMNVQFVNQRLNEEIRRRTRIVRIFPNDASCLRLIRALCSETHETWLEDSRYLNMALLAEQKKEFLRAAA
ncbi:hypothetical protein BURKHO8Y_270022 [Burkholderia sp. 8Y]|nr:hypothetical protein BURKHO8Y_270022 [Burkholderia sp. 8Y]